MKNAPKQVKKESKSRKPWMEKLSRLLDNFEENTTDLVPGCLPSKTKSLKSRNETSAHDTTNQNYASQFVQNANTVSFSLVDGKDMTI